MRAGLLFTGSRRGRLLLRTFRYAPYPFRILVRLQGHGGHLPADSFPFQEELRDGPGLFPKIVHPVLIRKIPVQFPLSCERTELLLDTGELFPVTERLVRIQVGVSPLGDILQGHDLPVVPGERQGVGPYETLQVVCRGRHVERGRRKIAGQDLQWGLRGGEIPSVILRHLQ